MRRAGFTLVEVALAMALLVVGLSAITAVYLTGLRWSGETRQQYTAMDCARQVIEQAALLRTTPQGDAAGCTNTDDLASGWLNGYFVRRQITGRSNLPANAGERVQLLVEVFAGGDQDDGELVYSVATSRSQP